MSNDPKPNTLAEALALVPILNQRADITGQFALASDTEGERLEAINEADLLSRAARAVESLAAQVERLCTLLQDVARSGVEVDDPRIGYRTVQMDRDTWQEVRDLAIRLDAEEAGR